MNKAAINLTDLGMVAGSRVAMGVGVGIALAGYLTPGQRKAIGLGLVALGVLSGVPGVRQLLASLTSGTTASGPATHKAQKPRARNGYHDTAISRWT
jgi:hypothetical protein